jgi:DNA polymerase III psi subunit
LVKRDFEWNYYEIPPQKDLLLSRKGNNKKKLLVLTPTNLSGTEHSLLRNILQAIGYDLEDDCLHCMLEPGFRYPLGNTAEQDDFKTCLAFGLAPEDLGLQIQPLPYRFFRLGGISICFSTGFSELQTNKKEKQALWSALKDYFKNRTG